MYDGNGRLIGRYRANGRPLREYIRLGTRPVATIGKNGRIHYIHTDHLGTPRAVSEPGGGVVWRWVSGPFGDTAPDERAGGPGKSFTFNLRFPGQYYDLETGRHYNYFRYYDPEIGRYAAKDPIGFAGGDTNLFGYVANDPVNFVDPKGLASYRARDFEDVRWGDLAFAVVDFTASTTEAAFGVGGMIASTGSGPAAPAVFLGSLGMASHGVYGMSNSAISAHNALYTREMSGVAESVGGALFGARGARAGEAVDIFGAIRPGAQAAACFDSATDIFDAANSLNQMDNNFDN